MICNSCGEFMEGDGYYSVIHCPNAVESRYAHREPYANPVSCHPDDCSATGEGCCYQEEVVPSEYLTAVEGGESIKVVQCKYCGKPKEANDE